MGASRVVEVNYIEFRLYLVALQVVQQMVVGYGGQVTEFEVIHVHREALLNLLLDKIIYNGVGLAAARRTQHDGRTEGIHHIDPAIVPTLFVIEACEIGRASCRERV